MSKTQKNKKKEYSSDDDTEIYENALMTNLMALSNKNKESSDEKKPTESRIEFVKGVLDGNKLKSMVDFDSCDTESSINTRLNKKIMDVKELFISMNIIQ